MEGVVGTPRFLTISYNLEDHRTMLVNGLWALFCKQTGVNYELKYGELSVSAHRFMVEIFLPPHMFIPDGTPPNDTSHQDDDDNYLRTFMEFIYRGSVEVREDRLDGLLEIAKLFEFGMLVDAIDLAKCRALEVEGHESLKSPGLPDQQEVVIYVNGEAGVGSVSAEDDADNDGPVAVETEDGSRKSDRRRMRKRRLAEGTVPGNLLKCFDCSYQTARPSDLRRHAKCCKRNKCDDPVIGNLRPFRCKLCGYVCRFLIELEVHNCAPALETGLPSSSSNIKASLRGHSESKPGRPVRKVNVVQRRAPLTSLKAGLSVRGHRMVKRGSNSRRVAKSKCFVNEEVCREPVPPQPQDTEGAPSSMSINEFVTVATEDRSRKSGKRRMRKGKLAGGTVTGNLLKCSDCSYQTARPSDLRRHAKCCKRNKGDLRPFRCQLCGYVCRFRIELEVHNCAPALETGHPSSSSNIKASLRGHSESKPGRPVRKVNAVQKRGLLTSLKASLSVRGHRMVKRGSNSRRVAKSKCFVNEKVCREPVPPQPQDTEGAPSSMRINGFVTMATEDRSRKSGKRRMRKGKLAGGTVTGNLLKCSDCSYQTDRPSDLRRHAKCCKRNKGDSPVIGNLRPFRCQLCGYVCRFRIELEVHNCIPALESGLRSSSSNIKASLGGHSENKPGRPVRIVNAVQRRALLTSLKAGFSVRGHRKVCFVNEEVGREPVLPQSQDTEEAPSSMSIDGSVTVATEDRSRKSEKRRMRKGKLVGGTVTGNLLKCPDCSYQTARPSDLRRHAKSCKRNKDSPIIGHLKPFRCQLCGYVCRFRIELEVHNCAPALETGLPSCSSNIKASLRGHSESKPGRPVRKINAVQRRALLTSLKAGLSVRGHRMVKRRSKCKCKVSRGWNPCSTCRKRFNSKANLGIHSIVRTSNFECDSCSCVFRSRQKLRRHWKKSHQLKSARPVSFVPPIASVPKNPNASDLASCFVSLKRMLNGSGANKNASSVRAESFDGSGGSEIGRLPFGPKSVRRSYKSTEKVEEVSGVVGRSSVSSELVGSGSEIMRPASYPKSTRARCTLAARFNEVKLVAVDNIDVFSGSSDEKCTPTSASNIDLTKPMAEDYIGNLVSFGGVGGVKELNEGCFNCTMCKYKSSRKWDVKRHILAKH